MISFERIHINDTTYAGKNQVGEFNVFQTPSWLGFLAEMHAAEPVIVAIKKDGRIVGYYTGLIVKKFGLKILGSPFRGWVTYFMGFNLHREVSYREVLSVFPSFVFNDLKCDYFEIVDPQLRIEDCEGLNYHVSPLPWFAIDLSPSEDEIFARIHSSGRRNIRKSVKNEVSIEETNDNQFANEYYEQYTQVLARRSLVPTYQLSTVRTMIDHIQPTSNLLLVRARNAENQCIATGIFLFRNKQGVYWGGASWREQQYLRPNEPLFWYAMKKLKSNGVTELHMGGECDEFKKKLGSFNVKICRVSKARNSLLQALINLALSVNHPYLKNLLLRKL